MTPINTKNIIRFGITLIGELYLIFAVVLCLSYLSFDYMNFLNWPEAARGAYAVFYMVMLLFIWVNIRAYKGEKE